MSGTLNPIEGTVTIPSVSGRGRIPRADPPEPAEPAPVPEEEDEETE